MTFSVAIVLVKTDHIHDYNGTRGGCATCAAVNIAGGIIKSLSTMYVALTLVTCGFLSSAWSSCPKALRRNHFSPVILKVRLNN
jgi:hypothetical protein